MEMKDRYKLRDDAQFIDGIPLMLPTYQIRAGPVIEVRSVSVQPNDSSFLGDGKRWAIYGEIEVGDGQGNICDEIFNQSQHDPQILSMDSSSLLSLTLTEPIITPFPNSKLKLHLKDAVRDLELVSGAVDMDFEENNGYEAETIFKHVKGNHGSGGVWFCRFPAAVVADVCEFVVRKMDDISEEKSEESNVGNDLDGSMELFGNITAHCKSNYGDSYPTKLFNVQKVKAEAVKYGTSIVPPRTLVAVPAYASLVIKSHLCDIDFDDAVFLPNDVDYTSKKIVSGGLIFEVKVRWQPAYPVESMTSTKDPLVSRCIPVKQIFRPIRRWPTSDSGTMMEVFSIFIVSYKDDFFKLYGSIDVGYSGYRCCIFKRRESDMFSCSKRVTCLEVDGPHEECFAGPSLDMLVILKDDRDQIFCYGALNWSYFILEHPISWYDRRICGIIPCVHGFVAIHYAIFEDAVQAKLKVLLSCNQSHAGILTTNVTGTIVAEYGNHDYSSPFKRERYRSILFSERIDSSSGLPCGIKTQVNTPLRLSKSVIAVPLDSSLIIDLDLCVTPMIEDTDVQVLKDVAEFDIGSESQWTISSRDYSITMSIDWSW